MIKNLLSLIGILLLVTNVSFSQTVNINEARSIAKNHLLTVNISTLKSARLKKENIQFKAAKIGVENKDTLFYILNDSVNNAFVIVSADQRGWPVLGYSMKGTFDEKKQPYAFKVWMEERGKEIAYIKANNLQPEEKTIREWNQLKSGTIASQSSGVDPLLKTTWDQGCFYNEQCPIDKQGLCGHTWAGCTATAMAQIMKYWNYPSNGTGSSNLDSKYGMLSADFGSTAYQWSQMPNNLTSQNSEVAKLMFHCGVAASIWYCIGGSGAYLADAADGLKRYFSYSNNLKEVQRGSNVEDWIALLKLELNSHRPILYAGSGSAGHAFVCDGYKDENYFHFNWGWGGAADGYYYIGSFNPLGHNFNELQHALVSICPNNPPQSYNGFSLATNALMFTASKSTLPVTLISSVNWTASSNQPWLKLNSNAGNAGSAKLDLTTEENSTGNSRSAIVTVSTVEFGFQTITVTQTAKITTTAGNLRNVLVGKIGETKSITLTGTIDARDFKTMRDEMPMLENIDLSNTTIVGYNGTEGTYDGQLQSYSENTIPGYAFKKKDDKDTIASSLRKIVFPTTASTIDSYAFNKCGNLSRLDIPESVKTIKTHSFAWCWFLRELTIAASVKKIEYNAFDLCDKLREINVDKNNADYSSIDGTLFDKQQNSLIRFPESKQGDYKIPQTVKVIKAGAFVFCRLLNSITIPATVDSIENKAIGFCNASVILDANNPKYSSVDGVLYNKNQTGLLFCPSSKKGNFTIAQGVSSIGADAFAGCGDLTSITIPNSVTSIGSFSFNSCQGFETIEIPSSVTSIGEWVFTSCYKLSSIKIPSSVSYIGDGAFNFTKLTSITVGQSVPLKIEEHVFLNFDKDKCTLYVPYGSKSAYQAAAYWKDFKNIVEATNGISLSAAIAQIGSEAGSTSSFELKANVNWTASCDQSWLTISTNSGSSNASLKLTAEANTSIVSRIATITVSAVGYEPQTIVVTQRASKAVFNVTAGTLLSTLTSSELSVVSRLTLTGTIDARDFKTMRDNMPLLEEIDLSKAIIVAYSGTEGAGDGKDQVRIYQANTIPFSAFMKDWKGKKNLKSIILPASMTKIDWSAFRDCDGLTVFSIPSSVVEIGGYAFMDNEGLSSIEIPVLVTSIGGGVFWNCTNLSIIKVFNPVPVDFTKTQSTNVFTGVNKTTCTLYVPSGSRATYQTADQWKDFTNIVEMPLDHAPYLKIPLQNIFAKPGDIEQIVDLKTIFADDDPNDVMSYALTSNTNTKIAIVKLDGSKLLLKFSDVEKGMAVISITATSNGKQVTSKFQVTLAYPTGNDLTDKSKGVKIYPNPTEGIFYVRFFSVPKNGEQLIISDLSGRMVMIKKINNEDELIDLSGYASGVYLLKTSSPELGVHKIILK